MPSQYDTSDLEEEIRPGGVKRRVRTLPVWQQTTRDESSEHDVAVIDARAVMGKKKDEKDKKAISRDDNVKGKEEVYDVRRVAPAASFDAPKEEEDDSGESEFESEYESSSAKK
jgi:hypothetical protein